MAEQTIDQLIAPYSDGAAAIGWPVASQGRPGFLVVIKADGLIRELNRPRLKVIAEFEALRLSDLHKEYLRLNREFGQIITRKGWFANIKDIAMSKAWQRLNDSAGALGGKGTFALHSGKFELQCPENLWQPDNLEYYLNIIAEHNPLTNAQHGATLFFDEIPRGSRLLAKLYQYAPGTLSSDIHDYPAIAALGFTLEALQISQAQMGAKRNYKIGKTEGWT